ncbi:MAG: M20/M25/M40 family metallo-hydrolase [Pseudomonadota bacterium]
MFRRQTPSCDQPRVYIIGLMALALLVASCAQTGSRPGRAAPSAADTLKAHVEILASDAFGGRETGTDGYARAASYVADNFAAAGLVAVGGGYPQDVPLYSVNPGGVTGSMTLTTGGMERVLEMNEDVSYFPPLIGLDTEGTISASGELIFVGQGLSAPSLGYDNYAEVDVEGKIVVVITGTPSIPDPAARFHLVRLDTKRMEAAARGAAGIIFADPSPRSVSRLTRLRRYAGDRALVIETLPDQAIPAAAMSHDLLTQLISSTGRDADHVLDEARDGRGESFPLAASAALSVTASAQRMDAFNIVGMLPGQDPSLSREAVVVTAHLDHLGTQRRFFFDRPENEGVDEIFNGAIDNALGVAIILDVAKRLSDSGGTARTVIFAAVTAEEAGLLGSQYLAESIEGLGFDPVANVNVDMPIMTYPFADVIGFGVEYSSIKAPLDAAAAAVGVVATPDPVPSMSLFVRSDHYRFVQRGVPSVFLFNGMSGSGRAGFDAFMDEHYHRPSDQADLPIRWQDAARFTDLSEDLVRRIADAPEAPTWNEGAVFAP